MFDFIKIIKNMFDSKNDSPIGLKHINQVQTEKEPIKSQVKKDIKISELLKKTVAE